MTARPLPSIDLMSRIRAEYQEVPGLRLSLAQAVRFWGLPRPICEAAFHALEAAGFLIRTADGRYGNVGDADR